jgi:hypothetical protein
MYVAASIFSAVLLRKVYLFQTLPEFDNVRQGTPIDMLCYSLPFAVVFTVYHSLSLDFRYISPLLF